MTLRHVSWALDLGELDAIARMILVTVAEQADDAGAAAPGLAKLARRADCSIDTVRRRLDKLAQKGLLEREDRRRADGSTDYMLLRLCTDDAALSGPGTVLPSPSTVLPSPSTVLPPPSTVLPPPSTVLPPPCDVPLDAVVGEAPEPQAALAHARAETEPPTLQSKTTPISPKIRDEVEAAHARARRGEGTTPASAFFEKWPLGAFEPLAPIESAWRALDEAQRQAAIDGLEAYRRACRLGERKTGGAAQYLRHRKWEVRAASKITAVRGGVYVILGSPAADAWLEHLRASNPISHRRGFPHWCITRDPETGKPATFRATLFPPSQRGPPPGEAVEGEAVTGQGNGSEEGG